MRRVRPGLRTLLLMLAVFMAAHIAHSSKLIDGQRYFSLMDDAMISMRFAQNLARGHGPVWNPGEPPVEGYTNPGWVLVMAALHLLPLEPRLVSLAVQILGALLVLATVLLVDRLSGRVLGEEHPLRLAPAMIFGFSHPVLYWSLQGFEVSLLLLLLTRSLLAALELHEGEGSATAVFAPMALAGWVRLDALAPTLALALAIGVLGRRRQALLGFAATAAVVLVPQTALRWGYYGLPLPATYYLKMTGYWWGYRVAHGGLELLGYLGRVYWLPVLIPLALALRRRTPASIVLGAVVLVQGAYSVWVGGDAWEDWVTMNRFLVLGMPALAVLVAEAAGEISAGRSGSRRIGWGFALLAGLCLSAGRPEEVAAFLFQEPPVRWGAGRQNILQGLRIREFTTPEARVALICAGALPYFSDRAAVDLLGKCDLRIARSPARVPAGFEHVREFRPGHAKFDAAWSIGELKPDVVAQVWVPDPATGPELTRGYRRVMYRGLLFHLREESENIHWDRITSRAGRERGR